MYIYEINIPEDSLSNINLSKYVHALKIPNFRGVFMRDTLPNIPYKKECGIVNLNTSSEPGSHWVCYYKDDSKRIYFDSYAQITPIEIQKYLKDQRELRRGIPCIKRNTDIVQLPNTSICGQLCLYILKALSTGEDYQNIINTLL